MEAAVLAPRLSLGPWGWAEEAPLALVAELLPDRFPAAECSAGLSMMVFPVCCISKADSVVSKGSEVVFNFLIYEKYSLVWFDRPHVLPFKKYPKR